MNLLHQLSKITVASVLALAFSACATDTDPASKETVHDWSKTALLSTARNQSPEFRAFVESVLNQDVTKLPYEVEAMNLELLINMGTVSALAEHCDISYEFENFLPMMQWQRKHLPESEHSGKKIAMIGAMHGYGMGRTDDWLEENKVDCGELKTTLRGQLFDDKF